MSSLGQVALIPFKKIAFKDEFTFLPLIEVLYLFSNGSFSAFSQGWNNPIMLTWKRAKRNAYFSEFYPRPLINNFHLYWQASPPLGSFGQTFQAPVRNNKAAR